MSEDYKKKTGIFMAAMGIPACGKSSVTKELGHLLDLTAFQEPEEADWPEAVHYREVSGDFNDV